MTTSVPTPRRWQAVGGATERAEPASGRRAWQLAAALITLIAAALWLWGMSWGTRPMTSTIVVLPLTLTVGALLIRSTSRHLPLVGAPAVLATGLALRLIGLWYRYLEAADGIEYHEQGIRLAESYRQLDFGADLGRTVPGTGTLRMAAGVVHALSFDDLLTAYAVFTLAAFAGCLLFLRALVVAVPDADHHRYTALVMLWPSLVFWPSSLGKEAWMMLGLGVTSLAVAHLLSGRAARGVALGAIGLLLLGLVRPHVGLLVIAALAVAGVLRRGEAGHARVGLRVLVAAAALVAGLLLADATAERFQVDRLGTEEVDATLAFTADRTTTGSATFDAVQVRSPVQYPLAVVTVLFRPFPFEARGLEAIATSAEAVALLVLLVASGPRLRAAARRLRSDPYLLYALVFVLAFCYAFSVIGNFGILARQRSQVLPFLFVLVALPAAPRHRRWQAFAERRRSQRSAPTGHVDRLDAPEVTARARTDPRPTRRWTAVSPPPSASSTNLPRRR